MLVRYRPGLTLKMAPFVSVASRTRVSSGDARHDRSERCALMRPQLSLHLSGLLHGMLYATFDGGSRLPRLKMSIAGGP